MSKNRPNRKPGSRVETLQRGRLLLSAWGVHEGALPPSTPVLQVISTLQPLIGRDPACDLLIAEWLGRLADLAAAGALVRWEAETADKDLKREIRRSLFRLQQKGVTAARVEEPRETFSLGAPAAGPEGYLGAIDGDGSRMAWLMKRDASGVMVLFTVINDREGMISVDAGTLPRARLAEVLKEMGASSPGAPVKVPFAYADALMHEAFRTRSPRPGNVKADYLLARADITGDPPAGAPPCPIRQILAPEAADPDRLAQSADLFRQKEFRSWVLPPEIARVHVQALVNAGSSNLVVSREASAERVVAIMDAALDDLVASPMRSLYSRRLDEMAYLYHLKKDAGAARLCFAVARALESPEGRRMQDVSFLRAFVFRAFAPMMAPPERDPAQAAAPPAGSDPSSELADGSSRIVDPSKVHEAGVHGAGRVDDAGAPGIIIRP